jgi:hypothetical protein
MFVGNQKAFLIPFIWLLDVFGESKGLLDSIHLVFLMFLENQKALLIPFIWLLDVFGESKGLPDSVHLVF